MSMMLVPANYRCVLSFVVGVNKKKWLVLQFVDVTESATCLLSERQTNYGPMISIIIEVPPKTHRCWNKDFLKSDLYLYIHTTSREIQVKHT